MEEIADNVLKIVMNVQIVHLAYNVVKIILII